MTKTVGCDATRRQEGQRFKTRTKLYLICSPLVLNKQTNSSSHSSSDGDKIQASESVVTTERHKTVGGMNWWTDELMNRWTDELMNRTQRLRTDRSGSSSWTCSCCEGSWSLTWRKGVVIFLKIKFRYKQPSLICGDVWKSKFKLGQRLRMKVLNWIKKGTTQLSTH